MDQQIRGVPLSHRCIDNNPPLAMIDMKDPDSYGIVNQGGQSKFYDIKF